MKDIRQIESAARELLKFMRERAAFPPGYRQPSGMDWIQTAQAADMLAEIVKALADVRLPPHLEHAKNPVRSHEESTG